MTSSCSSPFLILFIIISSTITSSKPICNLTRHPNHCKSILSNSNTNNTQHQTLISIHHSLSQSQALLTSLQHHQTCTFLLSLTIDYLSTTLKSLTNSLDSSRLQKAQTLLSATLTNQQTCLDQLQQPNQPHGANLTNLISKGYKSLSVTLTLFNMAYNVHTSVHLGQESKAVKVKKSVVVKRDGSGDFKTIAEAVAAAPDNADGGDGYYVINVKGGVYEERVEIGKTKTYVMMVGDGIGETVITGKRSFGGGFNTLTSSTFTVMGEGFIAEKITFQNTAGAVQQQAVAVVNMADASAFYQCSLEGYQDTLFAFSNRQFYRECDIYGTVDFIFGNAAAVFQNCNLFLRNPVHGQSNTITAQGRTEPSQATGFSIQNCKIKAVDNLGSTKNYLGRPWKEYSRTVYLETFMDNLIDPAGWLEWSGNFALTTLFYAEYKNSGPAADTSNRVKWAGYHVIDENMAVNFTVSNFINRDSWLSKTGVPVTGGL